MVRAAVCLALLGVAGAGCGAGVARPGAEKPLTVRSAPPRRLPVTQRAIGPDDAHDFDLALLVPRGARLRQLWYLHGRRAGSQALVEWVRSRRPSVYSADFPPACAGG